MGTETDSGIFLQADRKKCNQTACNSFESLYRGDKKGVVAMRNLVDNFNNNRTILFAKIDVNLNTYSKKITGKMHTSWELHS